MAGAFSVFNGMPGGSAANPLNWSSGTLPAAGDELFMSGGTMDITGDPLAGNPIMVGDPASMANPPVASLPSRPDVTFNITGSTFLDQNIDLGTTQKGLLTFNLEGTNAV